jgi:hypothetical protein
MNKLIETLSVEGRLVSVYPMTASSTNQQERLLLAANSKPCKLDLLRAWQAKYHCLGVVLR